MQKDPSACKCGAGNLNPSQSKSPALSARRLCPVPQPPHWAEVLWVAGCQQVLTSFWPREQGNLPTCPRMLSVSSKVWRSPLGLCVVALGMQGKLLFMEASSGR